MLLLMNINFGWQQKLAVISQCLLFTTSRVVTFNHPVMLLFYRITIYGETNPLYVVAKTLRDVLCGYRNCTLSLILSNLHLITIL